MDGTHQSPILHEDGPPRSPPPPQSPQYQVIPSDDDNDKRSHEIPFKPRLTCKLEHKYWPFTPNQDSRDYSVKTKKLWLNLCLRCLHCNDRGTITQLYFQYNSNDQICVKCVYTLIWQTRTKKAIEIIEPVFTEPPMDLVLGLTWIFQFANRKNLFKHQIVQQYPQFVSIFHEASKYLQQSSLLDHLFENPKIQARDTEVIFINLISCNMCKHTAHPKHMFNWYVKHTHYSEPSLNRTTHSLVLCLSCLCTVHYIVNQLRCTTFLLRGCEPIYLQEQEDDFKFLTKKINELTHLPPHATLHIDYSRDLCHHYPAM